MMKKILFSLFNSTGMLLASTQLAFAVDGNIVNCDVPGSPFNNLCNLTGAKFGSAFGQVITFVFVIAIMIALGFLVYGGIKWVTSGGEKGGVEEARNHVIAAVVGLIIVFLSYFIINLIVYFFTGESINNIKIPQLSITPVIK